MGLISVRRRGDRSILKRWEIMPMLTTNMEFEGSPFEEAQARSPGVRQLQTRWVLSLEWVAEIWNCFEGAWVRVGRYGTPEQAAQAYESAADQMKKKTVAMWAMCISGFCRDTFKRLKSSWLEAAQSRWGADDGITFVCLEYIRRHAGDAAAETIEQINGDAPYAALLQRISNPGIYPSWEDYEDYEDYKLYKKCWEAVKASEKRLEGFTNPIAYMERESGGFVGGKRPEDSSTTESMKRTPIEGFVYQLYPEYPVIGGPGDSRAAESIKQSLFQGEYLQAGNYIIRTGPGDTRTAESMKQIPSEFFSHHTHPGSYYDAGIQNLTDISKIIWVDSVRNTLLLDIAVQPGLAKTYAILFRNLLNAANLPIYERWTDIGSTVSRTWRNALKKVWSMQSGGPNIVSNGLGFFKSASKLAVGMVLFGNTPAVGAVGAMAPEAAEPGSLQAQDFEKSSNFAFGVVASVGTLVAILGFLMSVKWRRRHSVAGASAASAPAGALLNRDVNMAQTHTVLRSWRETEYCEVVVARREEEGVYAS